MLKRVLCLTLVLLLLLPAGFAQSLPLVSALLPDLQGQGAQLTITGEIKEWNAFKGVSLAAFEEWARNSSLTLQVGQDYSLAALRFLDSPVVQYAQSPDGVVILPGGTLYTGGEESLSALLGGDLVDLDAPGRFLSVLRAIRNALPALPPLLASYEETVKEGITIKNVGRGSQKVNYELTAAQWQGVWPQITQEIVSALEQELPGDPIADKAQAFLRQVAFDKKGTYKRFLDKDGNDIGWQFTGTLSLMGQDARKATLYGGYIQDGLYLSVKLPALRGKNDLTLALSYALEGSKIKLDGNYRRSMNGQAETLALAVSLNTAKGLSGKAALTLGETGQKNTVWTLTPKLALENGTYSGTVGLSRKKGTREFSLALNTTLAPGAVPAMPTYGRTVDLTGMDEAALAQERQRLSDTLAPALLPLLLHVPEENRLVVIHEMGRHLRVNGPVLSLEHIEESTSNTDYLVIKEEQNP